MKKSLSFTLLEVIIAIGLTALLLGILFRYYHQVSINNLKAHQLQQKIFSLSLFQEKLGQIFSQLSFEDDEEGETLLFCTREIRESVCPALFFKYDNGVDPDPAFCDELEGMIYLDQNKCLSLVNRSKNGTPRKEILLEKIAKISFRFFDTFDNSWKDTWSTEDDSLPTLIELSIFFADKEEDRFSKGAAALGVKKLSSTEGPPWQCIFFGSRDDNPILYRSKKV